VLAARARRLAYVTSEHDDPHARHTPDQIDELQDALGHVSEAIQHLVAERLDDFDDPDLEHALRHLKEARLWLNEILVNSGHEPEEGESEHVDPEREKRTPIH
jgi:hypothetical protein